MSSQDYTSDDLLIQFFCTDRQIVCNPAPTLVSHGKRLIDIIQIQNVISEQQKDVLKMEEEEILDVMSFSPKIPY